MATTKENQKEFEERQAHIEHKKAALNKQKKTRKAEFVEYGFDDEEEMKDYEKFLK